LESARSSAHKTREIDKNKPKNVFFACACTALKDVQVLAAFGFAVATPHLAQQPLHLEAGGGPRAPVLSPRRAFAHQIL